MHDRIYCSVAITENLAMPRLRCPEFGKDFSERPALTFTDIGFLISKNSGHCDKSDHICFFYIRKQHVLKTDFLCSKEGKNNNSVLLFVPHCIIPHCNLAHPWKRLRRRI